MRFKVLIIFGTRPEAIKMALLVKRLKEDKSFKCDLCVTGQHRELLDQVIELFELKPDYDLDIMNHKQDLFDVTSNVILGLRDILKERKYNMVLVHGDTTTSMAGALAAFYEKISVGHIEAGLRTYEKYSPWPEEMNRQITGRLATIHFAPTQRCKENLIKENIPENIIFVTGNTVIDSLQWVLRKIENNIDLYNQTITQLKNYGITRKMSQSWENGTKKMVLITGHRRENFGERFHNICIAIKELAEKYPKVDFIYPVHLNPNVRNSIKHVFGYDYKENNKSNMYFIKPLNYNLFVLLMKYSYIILTDSGGIQEEAPGLKKPVLVMRDITERQEAVKAGTVKLVGANTKMIKEKVSLLIDDENEYEKMSQVINPYGEGNAVDLIIKNLKSIITHERKI